MLFRFLYPRLAQESIRDFARVQKLGPPGKSSPPGRFSESPVVVSGVLSWKGD